MIGFFKQSYLAQYIVLLLLAFVLWLPAMIAPSEIVVPDDKYLSPAWHLIAGLLIDIPLAGIIAAFLITLAGALLINAVLGKYDLVPKNTLVPAFLYILVMSHQPGYLSFHQVLIPVFLIVVVVYYLFDMYNEADAYEQVFYSGLLIAIASLFYLPAVGFIVLLWATFFVYRLYSWREWIIALIAFLVIYLFLGVYYFMTDQFFVALDHYALFFNNLHFDLNFRGSETSTSILSGIVFLLFLQSFAQLLVGLQENIISVRKRFGSVFWLLLISLITGFFLSNDLLNGMRFFLVGLVIVLSFALLSAVKLKWYEWISWLVIAFVLVNNYYIILLKLVI